MKASTLLNIILAAALIIICGRQLTKGITSSDNATTKTSTKSEANAAIENMMTRTSVRAFAPEKITDNQIETMLKAGMAAPTSMDKRPWHFIVVTDQKQIEKISAHNPHGQFITQAPLCIVVCGDMNKAIEGAGHQNWLLDTAAASENILLAANALGLGAVWTGEWPYEERMQQLSKILDLPKHIVPLCTIVIGHPAHQSQPKDKWNKNNVSYNEYDN